MPRYEVTMKVTKMLNKPIVVYASDEAEVEEKACDIVLGWEDVVDCEAVDFYEVDV